MAILSSFLIFFAIACVIFNIKNLGMAMGQRSVIRGNEQYKKDFPDLGDPKITLAPWVNVGDMIYTRNGWMYIHHIRTFLLFDVAVLNQNKPTDPLYRTDEDEPWAALFLSPILVWRSVNANEECES